MSHDRDSSASSSNLNINALRDSDYGGYERGSFNMKRAKSEDIFVKSKQKTVRNGAGGGSVDFHWV